MRLIDAEYLIDHVCACMENDRLLKTATKDEILQMIEDIPSAQPEYEPVTLEDFARTMSGITVWGFAAWQGWALALIKEQGFVVCKETK